MNLIYNTGRSIVSLSQADHSKLKQQLRANLRKISDDFSGYTDCIAVSLDEKKVNVRRLKAFSLSLYVGCDEHNLVHMSEV